MSEKLEEYFDTSLHVERNDPALPLVRPGEQNSSAPFLNKQVRQANYVFAGPGSPTYALAQWAPLHFEDDLSSVLGATVRCVSPPRQRLTLGAFTAPIYEVYKVGIRAHVGARASTSRSSRTSTAS